MKFFFAILFVRVIHNMFRHIRGKKTKQKECRRLNSTAIRKQKDMFSRKSFACMCNIPWHRWRAYFVYFMELISKIIYGIAYSHHMTDVSSSSPYLDILTTHSKWRKRMSFLRCKRPWTFVSTLFLYYAFSRNWKHLIHACRNVEH